VGRAGGKGAEPVSRLSTDIANIFEGGKFADCTIACEGREFRCHKNILSARYEGAGRKIVNPKRTDSVGG
jgi:hypothetical protein